MSSLLDMHATLSIDTDGFDRGLDDAEERANQFGNTSDETGGKVNKLGPLTVAAGNLIAAGVKKAGGAMIDMGKSAFNSSIDTETAMAKVSTIMDTSALSTEEMGTAISGLSSKFGVSVSDIADSVYDVISATGDTAEAVNLVEQATMLAKGGFAETGDAVSVLTTAINAYGLEMTDAQHISDSLITVQNLGVTTVGELSSQMGKAIATGASYGVNLENLETGYIAMTKAGIGTAESTTYMSSMMNELGKKGSDVADIIQSQTGKSFGQLMEEGYSLGDVLGILNDFVDGDSEALMNLWGSAEAGKAASAIVGQGLGQFNDWLKQVEKSSGATEKAYKKMSDTTADKIKQLKTSFTNLGVQAIEPIRAKMEEFIPKVTAMIQSVDIDAVRAKISELKPVIEGIAVAIGIVSAGITAFNVVQGIKLAMEAAEVTTLGALIAAEASAAAATMAAMLPFIAIAAAIAGVIAAGVALYKHWDEVKAKCSEIWESVKTTISGAWESLKATASATWSSITASLSSAWESLKSIASDTWAAITATLLSAWESIKTFASETWESIKTTVSGAWNGIKTTVKNAGNSILTGVKTAWNGIKTATTTVFNSVKTTITNAWNNIKTTVTNAINNAKTTITNGWNTVKTITTTVFNAVKNTVSNVWNSIKTIIITMVTPIKTTIMNGFSAAKTSVVNSFNSIKSSISNTMSSALSTVKEKIEAIKTKARNIFNGIKPKLHLSLPHVSVSGGSPPFGIGGKGSLPSFSVTWNRKAMNTPYLLDGAQIFGFADNSFLGGGEAGKEVIYGHESLMNDIRNATGDNKSADKILEYLVGGGLANDLAEAMVGMRVVVDGRDFGRVVREFA